jgi:hypothetical protein
MGHPRRVDECHESEGSIAPLFYLSLMFDPWVRVSRSLPKSESMQC